MIAGIFGIFQEGCGNDEGKERSDSSRNYSKRSGNGLRM